MNMSKKRDGIILDRAHDITLKAFSWLWRFWIAAGKVHLLVGSPGSGKTTFLADLLAAFSTGGLLPDGTRAPQVFCMYWSGEDCIEDTVGVRLKVARANLRNILILRGVAERGRKRYFKPSDLPALVNEIKQLRADGIDVRVIAIDPLPAGSGNSNSNDDVRRTLEPLIALAEEEGIAIIGVRHLSKASGKKKLADRVNGSVAHVAVSRIVMFISKVIGTGTAPDNPPCGVLVRAKTNIGPMDGGFSFTIHPASIEVDGGTADSTYLKWDPVALTGDPESIVQEAESATGATASNDVAEEIRFLQDILSSSPVHSNEVLERGKAEGFTPEKLRQALVALGGKSDKEAGRSRSLWYWSLPGAGFDHHHSSTYDDSSHRRDERRSDDHRTGSHRTIDTRAYDNLRSYRRHEDRFGNTYDNQTPEDGKVEKDEKSENTKYADTPRWSSLIDLSGSDDDDRADEPVGI